MQLGLIGLGKMGGNMSQRLLQAGHEVIVYDNNPAAVVASVEHGAVGAQSLIDLAEKMAGPRAVWVMVPAGDITENTIRELAEVLSAGDIIIDGGNSNYKDSIRRAEVLKAYGIGFVDVGTSGGVWGLKEGYSMMIGGTVDSIERLRPIFESLAPGKETGWGHVGPHGAGHFVKMVHNGIEYGLMQAYAEGFEIMKNKAGMNLDVSQIAEIWRNGSVVRSWLLDLTANALAQNPEMEDIKGWVADSGEGRWTVFEAIDQDIPAPVITMSLMMRFISRQEDSYAAKLLAAMRNQFGGHAILKED